MLQWIHNTLVAHHSRDRGHLALIKQQLKSTMSNQDKARWRCGPCRRMVKATQSYCPACGNWWESVIDHTYVQPRKEQWDQSWTWNAWEETAAKGTPRGAGRDPSRPRSSSARRRSQKGKGKGKGNKTGGKGADLPKEHNKPHYSLPSAPQPWIADGEVPAAVATSSTTQAMTSSTEVITALRKLYPDPAQMPSELRTAVEKTEAQTSRQVTRDLHTATSQLGRAKKSLAEAKEARGQHRKAWFAFLVECANTWREQQKAYADHEQVLKSQEEKARLEIVTITNQIQQLTSKNVTDSGLEVVNTSTPPALPPETAEAMEEDLEEKQLRLSAQNALTACLGTVKEENEAIVVDSEGEEGRAGKRQRSEEPPKTGQGLSQRSGGAPTTS